MSGDFLAGLGAFIFFGVISYSLYRLSNIYIEKLQIQNNKENKYLILEEMYLDNFAKEKNIDLDQKLIERKDRKSFEKAIKEKMINDLNKSKK